jgi:predicted AAA+ superfamily ATPase
VAYVADASGDITPEAHDLAMLRMIQAGVIPITCGGSLFSYSNIAKYLKSQRQQVPTQLVIDYSLALTQAYFIHKVPRIDIQGLKIF